MSFELTILGSGAALPTGKRNPAAQYVNCNERHILIDCGEGTQNQLRRFGIKIQKIRHILISHLHGDHFFGLAGLLSTMNLLGRTQGVTLYAPPLLKDIIELQLKASGFYYQFKVDFVPLEMTSMQKIMEDKLIEIHAFPMKHRIPTYGFVIREKPRERPILGEELRQDGVSLQAVPFFRKGIDYKDEKGKLFRAEDYTLAPKKARSYAYCSDTAYYEPLIECVKESDLLYHEATFIERHKDRAKSTLHSTAMEAAHIAQKAGVGKLILGHISSRYENTDPHLSEAKSVFENTLVVEDGMSFEI
ncbi:MAG: ribonuclease [Crocinitomicaceae bacterium]|jgi:ribonuclease Z|nr:ribonuclease [Crocinitomicaceae bacterium]